jgi:hypothetical protein
VKTTTKLMIAGAMFGAAMSSDVPAHAFGDAPWCAVIEMGIGDVYWDCEYRTVEECVPNVLAGNRGFCNLNPYGPGPAAPPAAYRRHRKPHPRH